MQDHLKALKPLLEDLAHRARLPLEVKAQWQPHQMAEEPLRESAERAPLRPRVDESANFACRTRQELREHVCADQQRERDRCVARLSREGIDDELQGDRAERREN